jgi:DNA-binding transcriptional regulator YiaG
MKKKYKSELYQAIHEESVANFKVGAISEEQLRYFESRCFVQGEVPAIATSQSAASSSRAIKPSRAYASKAN